MSSLRIIGTFIGIIGFFLSFFLFRGPKWRKSNFIFINFLSLIIVAISINPNFTNFLADIFALEEYQRGRILALLIVSNFVLLFLLIRNRIHLDSLKYQFDILIRKISADKKEPGFSKQIKPVMVLIPAYNEADNLKILLKKIPDKVCGKKVGALIIDDGSTDNTKKVPGLFNYAAVQNLINRGQGAACRLGYDLLKNEAVEILITMDADNQHLPEDIKKLILPIEENKYDLVIGSRILGNHENDDRIRSAGISILTKVINIMTGLKLTDCSSGFKAFNVKELRRIHLKEDQFQSSEVIIESAKKGLRIGEVPITVTQRKFGESKKGTNWSYGFNFTKAILKAWWR